MSKITNRKIFKAIYNYYYDDYCSNKLALMDDDASSEGLIELKIEEIAKTLKIPSFILGGRLAAYERLSKKNTFIFADYDPSREQDHPLIQTNLVNFPLLCSALAELDENHFKFRWPLLISLSALILTSGLSAYTIYQSTLHNKKSLRPFINLVHHNTTDTNYPIIELGNVGLGPAKISKVNIYYEGSLLKMSQEKALVHIINEQEKKAPEVYKGILDQCIQLSFPEDQTVGVSQKYPLIKVKDYDNSISNKFSIGELIENICKDDLIYSFIRKAFLSVDIEVYYESLTGEPFSRKSNNIEKQIKKSYQ